jgi:hypothetical protein
MQLTVAYQSHSAIVRRAGSLEVALAPNLRRDRVSFVGALQQPLRFREAMSALHDVVIGDLRYKPKDRTAYRAYLAEQQRREDEIRRAGTSAGMQQLQAEWPEQRRKELADKYQQMQKLYWDARQKYNDYLQQHDPGLWRLLVPMDPVITVAPDVLFFECFSADESSYGCLTVNRDAFTAEEEVALGTTNVDYSWALYEHFQELRSYRETRFTVVPWGFEAQIGEAGGLHEEKIDLPPSWLRGFMQLQAAMSFPMRRVPLSREGLYSILVWLRRHKARKSPRAVRFELEPGKPVVVVLEPWEKRFVLHGTAYPGGRMETIRTWGRDRLLVLGRLLPLLDGADVYLLGTGLPSFWCVRMGEMRLTLGLSGWTVNDWTGASALDQIAPPAEPSHDLMGDIAATFREKTELTFEQVRSRTGATAPLVLAGLNKLALLGQVIHDLPAGLYRWRQVMPVAFSLDQIGPENPETVGGRELVQRNQVHITRDETTASGLRLLVGNVPQRPSEVVLDGDGRILRGKCTCSHHFKSGLRRGPCRHLQALRTAALRGVRPTNLERWYEQVRN